MIAEARRVRERRLGSGRFGFRAAIFDVGLGVVFDALRHADLPKGERCRKLGPIGHERN